MPPDENVILVAFPSNGGGGESPFDLNMKCNRGRDKIEMVKFSSLEDIILSIYFYQDSAQVFILNGEISKEDLRIIRRVCIHNEIYFIYIGDLQDDKELQLHLDVFFNLKDLNKRVKWQNTIQEVGEWSVPPSDVSISTLGTLRESASKKGSQISESPLINYQNFLKFNRFDIVDYQERVDNMRKKLKTNREGKRKTALKFLKVMVEEKDGEVEIKQVWDQGEESDMISRMDGLDACRTSLKEIMEAVDLLEEKREIVEIDTDLILQPKHKSAVYVPSEFEGNVVMKSLHFGQRKLFLSEVEFLTQWFLDTPSAINRTLVVYAGSASGLHLPMLFEMFPMVKWYLADPAPFDKQIRQDKYPQILKILNDLFLESTCEEIIRDYPDYYILLISDIRADDPTSLTPEQNTNRINEDNLLQARWVYHLNARRSMLKFHPPYPDNTTDPDNSYVLYFRGACYFGVWAPKSSTEVRLVLPSQTPFIPLAPKVRSEKRKEEVRQAILRSEMAPNVKAWLDKDANWSGIGKYHCRGFEERLYHYNINNRFVADVAAEFLILRKYLTISDNGWPSTTKFNSVVRMSKILSDRLFWAGFHPLRLLKNKDDASLIEMETRFCIFLSRLARLAKLELNYKDIQYASMDLSKVYQSKSLLITGIIKNNPPLPTSISIKIRNIINKYLFQNNYKWKFLICECFGSLPYRGK